MLDVMERPAWLLTVKIRLLW